MRSEPTRDTIYPKMWEIFASQCLRIVDDKETGLSHVESEWTEAITENIVAQTGVQPRNIGRMVRQMSDRGSLEWERRGHSLFVRVFPRLIHLWLDKKIVPHSRLGR